jgi:hypothetical protein
LSLFLRRDSAAFRCSSVVISHVLRYPRLT